MAHESNWRDQQSEASRASTGITTMTQHRSALGADERRLCSDSPPMAHTELTFPPSLRRIAEVAPRRLVRVSSHPVSARPSMVDPRPANWAPPNVRRSRPATPQRLTSSGDEEGPSRCLGDLEGAERAVCRTLLEVVPVDDHGVGDVGEADDVSLAGRAVGV